MGKLRPREVQRLPRCHTVAFSLQSLSVVQPCFLCDTRCPSLPVLPQKTRNVSVSCSSAPDHESLHPVLKATWGAPWEAREGVYRPFPYSFRDPETQLSGRVPGSTKVATGCCLQNKKELWTEDRQLQRALEFIANSPLIVVLWILFSVNTQVRVWRKRASHVQSFWWCCASAASREVFRCAGQSPMGSQNLLPYLQSGTNR